MNFTSIKEELGVSTLTVKRSNKWNESDDSTKWYSALLDGKVVSVHNDTVTEIESNPESDSFGIKSMGQKESSKGYKYELLILVKYKEVKYDKVL